MWGVYSPVSEPSSVRMVVVSSSMTRRSAGTLSPTTTAGAGARVRCHHPSGAARVAARVWHVVLYVACVVARVVWCVACGVVSGVCCGVWRGVWCGVA